MTDERKAEVGDVFQINENCPQKGWVGAFLMATEIKSWGVMGFVHVIENHETAGRVFIRMAWDKLDYIGPAVMVPEYVVKGEDDDA